jgi:microcin C transport system ATP-binding protein
VGESGSGKSITAYSILQLLRDRGMHCTGRIDWQGQNLITADEPTLQRIRGREMAMIFQEPMSALNPLHKVHRQIAEAITLHQVMDSAAVRQRVMTLLEQVGLGEQAERIAGSYPHQLSGGQRQRVMIAMAIANTPKVLIADEPTTALDVTTQTHIMELLRSIQREHGMALLLISHDVPMVKRLADTLYVMQHGKVVEHNTTTSLIRAPQHPYTQLLLNTQLASTPPQAKPTHNTLYTAQSIHVRYPTRRSFWGTPTAFTHAVNDISLSLLEGHTLGIVGESGSGKSTLAMALLRLQASDGTFHFMGQNISALSRQAMRPLRRHLQVVLQDPFNALSPRLSIGHIIGEGLRIHAANLSQAEQQHKIDSVLTTVGLEPAMQHRYPHEFSGGQRQRVAIARALILQPKVVILDEPTSALDVATQKQIIDLLRTIQAEHGVSYIVISHDLRVIRALSHRIIVMKDGAVVEHGNADVVLAKPAHAYTRALLEAAELL